MNIVPPVKMKTKRFCVYRDRLRTVITAESRAYGFTLLIGGSGMFLLDHEEVPGTLDVFLFVAGAITAMLIAVSVSFRRLGQPVFLQFNLPVVPWLLTHVFSILGGLGATRLGTAFFSGHYAFYTVAVFGTLTYNLLLGLESEMAASSSQSSEENEC